MQSTKTPRLFGTVLTVVTSVLAVSAIAAFIWYVNGTDTNTGALVTNAALAVVSMLSLAILAVSVFKNWEMAEAARLSAQVAADTLLEMRNVRDEETAPYVLIYFDVPYGQHFIYLVVKNVGKSLATNVSIEVDPPLTTTWEGLPDLAFVSGEIGTIPPGYEMRTLFDDTPAYFGQNLPLRYTALVSYSGGIKTERRTSEQLLDLTPFKNVVFTTEKDLEDLIKEVKDLNRTQGRAVDALRQIVRAAAGNTEPKEMRRIGEQEQTDGETELPPVEGLPSGPQT